MTLDKTHALVKGLREVIVMVVQVATYEGREEELELSNARDWYGGARNNCRIER